MGEHENLMKKQTEPYGVLQSLWVGGCSPRSRKQPLWTYSDLYGTERHGQVESDRDAGTWDRSSYSELPSLTHLSYDGAARPYPDYTENNHPSRGM